METPGFTLVANPTSGGGRGAAAAERVAEALSGAGRATTVRLTGGPGEAQVLAEDAEPGHCLVAVGGDGTIHEVVRGLLNRPSQPGAPPPLLGVVPVGGGNDYARALLIPRGDPAAAARVLLEGRPLEVSAGLLSGTDQGQEVFLNNVGLAFLSDANAWREWLRFLPSQLTYFTAGLIAAANYAAERYVLTVDDVSLVGRFPMIQVGLGPYCGGGIELTPGAHPSHERFEVFVLGEHSLWRTANAWASISRGELGPDRARLAGRRIRLEGPPGFVLHADGEVRRAPQGLIELHLRPKALRVLVPSPKAPGRPGQIVAKPRGD